MALINSLSHPDPSIASCFGLCSGFYLVLVVLTYVIIEPEQKQSVLGVSNKCLQTMHRFQGEVTDVPVESHSLCAGFLQSH